MDDKCQFPRVFISFFLSGKRLTCLLKEDFSMTTSRPVSLLLLSLLLLLFSSCRKGDKDIFLCDLADPFECAKNNPDTWVWAEIEGMICRDGSGTGIGIRMQENEKNLVIFLEGGGACYNPTTCGGPSSFVQADFEDKMRNLGRTGIFDDKNVENPVQDWNIIYVPYCTGDLHAGTVENVTVPGVNGLSQFVGHRNMEKILALAGPRFLDADKVLLTGVSAGGLGTLFNFEQVANTFPDAEISLVDDSGPLLADDAVMTPCYQQLFRDLWGLDSILPPACTGCFGPAGDGLAEYMPFLSATYPDANFGLLSFQKDIVVRVYYSDGLNNCLGIEDIGGDLFQSGLLDLRDNTLIPTGKWSTFFPKGAYHTFLTSRSFFFFQETKGKSAAEFMGEVINGGVLQVSN